tara:strand:+ start:2563 stop:3057 length:495 start_codon:yes stop_codon:yes gene_type:complete
MKKITLISKILLLCIFSFANTINAKAQFVTITNHTNADMIVQFTLVVPQTCQNANGQGAGDDLNETVITVPPQGTQNIPRDASEVVNQVIATPDPFCVIAGSNATPAYYSDPGQNCGGINRCGLQDVVGPCVGARPSYQWCIVVTNGFNIDIYGYNLNNCPQGC